MIAYKQIHKKVVTRLKKELSPFLTYHDYKHTLHVINKSIFLAKKLNVSGDELCMLKIACLYHDTGFLVGRENHEMVSCQILKSDIGSEIEPDQLKKISGMIMATQIPAKPTNLLEEIIADADLEYLGTNKFDEIGDKLKRELFHFYPKMTEKDWNEIQIKFLSNHSYFTDWCRKYREPAKQLHLKKLIENRKNYH